MMARAVREGWPMSPQKRQEAIAHLRQVVADPTTRPRLLAIATKALETVEQVDTESAPPSTLRDRTTTMPNTDRSELEVLSKSIAEDDEELAKLIAGLGTDAEAKALFDAQIKKIDSDLESVMKANKWLFEK